MISSFLVKPSVTPRTMLLTSVRVRPCRAFVSRSSSGRRTTMVPSSPRSTVRGAGTSWVSSPLGPLTETVPPSMVTLVTAAGTATGRSPMRDISVLLSRSPDVGEDFPTHTLLGCLPVGQEAGGRGQDRHAQAAEDLGQVGGLRVHTQARLRDATDPGDGALTAVGVLQLEDELGAHLGLLLGPAEDVALCLQDVRDAGLQLRVRHGRGLVVRPRGVPDPREHVRDRVGHGHVCCFFLTWFPAGAMNAPGDLWR